MVKERSLSASAESQNGVVFVLSEDAAFQNELQSSIGSSGFECRYADGVVQARPMLAADRPALVVIDGGMGGRNGSQVCQSLRSLLDCPVLIIDHQGDTIDRIVALELGADDCLTYPVERREILARVRALVRRRNRDEVKQAPMLAISRRWRLHLTARQLFGPDQLEAVTLTTSEQKLFVRLVNQAGEPLALGAFDGDEPDCITIGQRRTTLCRLRRKLLSAGFDPLVIQSVRKGGYVFAGDVASVGVIAS